MKATTTLLITLTLMVSSLPGFAARTETKTLDTALLNEGFESALFPPAGWHIQQYSSSTWITPFDPDFVHTGLSAAFVHVDASDHNEWLVSPSIDLTTPGLESAMLSFWCKGLYSEHSTVKLYLDKAGDGFQDSEVIWNMASHTDWTQYVWRNMVIDLTPYLGSSIHLAWQYVDDDSGSGGNMFSLDDILLTVPVFVPKTTIAIEKIGYGSRVTAEIKNTGVYAAENIEWTLTVKGGMQGKINVVSTGTIEKLKRVNHSEDTTSVGSGSFFGFGMVDITVTASTNDANPKTVSRSAKGFVILSKCYPMVRLFGNQSILT